MIIDELIAILGYDIKGEAELNRFNRGIDAAEKNAREAASAINAMSVAVGTFVGTVAVEAFSRLSSAISSFPQEVISTSALFEGFETSLTTIEGSSEKARSSMDWITDFAAKTPYELAGVTDAFIKLKAYGIDPVDGTLTMLGDTASAMNKPLNQAVEAFADATNFQFERLREFGLTASQKGNQVTFQWTKNGKQLTQVVKKDGAEIQKFLKDHFGSTFNGAMIRQSKTWNGMMSNMSDTWQLFQKRVGDAGFFDEVKGRLGDVLDTIGEWDKSGALDKAASAISDFLTGAMRTADHLAGQLWTVGKGAYFAADGIVNLISRVTGLNKAASAGLLGAGLLGSTKMGRGMLMAIARRVPQVAALLVIDDIITGLKGGDSYIGSLKGGQEALDGLRQQMQSLADASSQLFNALTGVAGIDFSKWNFTQFLNDELVKFIHDATDIARDLTTLVETLRGLLGTKNMDEAKARGDRVSGWLEDNVFPKWLNDFMGWDKDGDPNAGAPPTAPPMPANQNAPVDTAAPQANETPPVSVRPEQRGATMAPAPDEQSVRPTQAWKEGAPPAVEEKGDLEGMRGSLSFLFDKRFWIGDAADGKSLRDALAVNVGSGALDSGGGETAKTPDLTPLYDLMGQMKAGAESLLGQNIMGALSNMNANLAKMTGDAMAKQVNATITDARQDNRNQSTNLGAISVVVNGVANVSEAVGRQVGAAVQSGAARGVAGARPARIEGSN